MGLGPVFVTVAASEASQSTASSHNSRQLLQNKGTKICLQMFQTEKWLRSNESPRPRQHSGKYKRLYLPLLGWKMVTRPSVQRNPRRWMGDGRRTSAPPHIGFRADSPAREQRRCLSVAPASGTAKHHFGEFNSHRIPVRGHGCVQTYLQFRRRKTRSSLINSAGPLHIRLPRSRRAAHFLPALSTLRVGVRQPGLHFGSNNR